MIAAKLSSVRVNAATRMPMPAQDSAVITMPQRKQRKVHLHAQEAEHGKDHEQQKRLHECRPAQPTASSR